MPRWIEFYSFDCANKTLGFVHAWINVEIRKDLETAQTPGRWLALVKTWLIIKEYGVVDLLGGAGFREIDEISRARALKQFCELQDVNPDAYVLIENQSNINGGTGPVQSQLLFAFADANTRLVNPRRKNKISLGPSTEYRLFADKFSSTYDANKAHTTACLFVLMEIFGLKLTIDDKSDDLADAIMQMLAFAFSEF